MTDTPNPETHYPNGVPRGWSHYGRQLGLGPGPDPALYSSEDDLYDSIVHANRGRTQCYYCGLTVSGGSCEECG